MPEIDSNVYGKKNKFVFAINKGINKMILRSDPGRVNDTISEENRRIPFKNMIYIGDGPTDIPCFSLITRNGGRGLGIIQPEKPERGAPLWKGRRITVGPYRPNYEQGSDLRLMIKALIRDISASIYEESKMSYRP
ncbi:MAG: hypothetical protein ABDH63_04745 [Candidatus Caldarchaeales archaeon]